MATLPPFKVRVVNPRKKGKTMAKKKRKKSTRRRKRRRNPATPARTSRARAPARRRSSRAAPRRRRRRCNPGSRGRAWPYGYGPQQMLWYGLGHLAQAFAVRRFGDAWGKGVMGKNAASPYAGQGWSFKNYLIAVITGYVGAKAIERTKWGKVAAEQVWRSAVDNVIIRMMWTEVLGRSKWAQDTFGQSDAEQMAALRQMNGYGNLVPAGALGAYHAANPGYGATDASGSVYDDGQGGRFVMNDQGQWVAMQGTGYGNLVPAGALGSDYETIAGMGALLDVDVADKAFDMQSRLMNQGATDPYVAVYQ